MSPEELHIEYQIDVFFMNISIEMAQIGARIWEYRAIQAKTENLTAKVLGPNTSETYIVGGKIYFYLSTPLQF